MNRGAWLVLVERDAPHREVGLVALADAAMVVEGPVGGGNVVLVDPDAALARLAVAYGVEVSGGDLHDLAERWREGAPLHEDPRAVALFWPRSGRTWDRVPLVRQPDETDRQLGLPQATALPEHGLVTDRTRPGVASGDGSVGGPPEAPAVVGVDGGSPVGYTEGAAADRRTDATPGPEGSASGPSCVWCHGPLPPPTDVGGRPRLTCSLRCRAARSRAARREAALAVTP